MIIQVDTREKDNDKIITAFDVAKVKHFRSKLYFGDYANFSNMNIVVERKKDIREIATNVTSKLSTFEEELKKLWETDSRMVVLITQDKIDGRKIESLEDVMLWEPKEGQGTVNGMTVYRKLAGLRNKYPIDIQFCSRVNAGKRILEILSNE